jgi:hypothetical protein
VSPARTVCSIAVISARIDASACDPASGVLNVRSCARTRSPAPLAHNSNTAVSLRIRVTEFQISDFRFQNSD